MLPAGNLENYADQILFGLTWLVVEIITIFAVCVFSFT